MAGRYAEVVRVEFGIRIDVHSGELLFGLTGVE